MNPDSLLNQLKDIHSPEAVSWWPFAIGWWLVGLLALIVIVGTVSFIVKYYTRNAWRRMALKEFNALKTIYLQHPNIETISKLNALLKRSISSIKHNPIYLSYTDKQWADCLRDQTDGEQTENENKESSNSILKQSEIKLLSSGQYQAHYDQLDAHSFNRIEKWIKTLR